MLGIGAGGSMVEEKRKRLAMKTSKVEKIKEKRKVMRPFIYKNSFVKMNPLRELELMKSKG